MEEKRGGEGVRATRTRPRSTISNKSLVLIVTFATWSSFVPINLKRPPSYRSFWIYTKAINPVGEQGRSKYVDSLFGHRWRGGGGRNSMVELARLADQTFQRRSNILQRLLEPIGRSWSWTSANSLPILSADAYLWTRDGDIAEDG